MLEIARLAMRMPRQTVQSLAMAMTARQQPATANSSRSIVHVLPQDGVGGVEVAVRSMSIRDDLNVEFEAMLLTGSRIDRLARRTTDSPFRSWLNPLAHIRIVRRILKVTPDIILCSLWRSVPATVVAKICHPRSRLVLFLHLDTDAHRVDRLLTRLAVRFADAVWADSVASLTRRIDRIDKPKRVISFVTERLQPAVHHQPGLRFVSWSRLHWQKGIDRALGVIADLVRRGEAPRFDVWGPDGGEHGRLVSLVASLGIEKHVRFHGPVEHSKLSEIAAHSTFFLQLSRYEGMGMSVVEAMQLGLVPIVTPVGEFDAYIDDGLNGYLVDAAQPGETAQRVLDLLARDSAFAAMRTAAIRTWQSTQTYPDDVIAAAEELLSGGVSAPDPCLTRWST